MLNAKLLTDEILWKSLRKGDEQAFETLFERYYTALVSYGNSFMPQSDRVQDCIQDVFVDIWLYRQSLQEWVVVKAYLLSCLRKRMARTYQRERIFRQTTSLEDIEFTMDFSVEEQLISDEITKAQATQLNRLINQLPPRQKETLYLRFHQGLSIEQIAEMLDIHSQSVSNHLHRAVQQLRKEWKGDFMLLFLLILGNM
ncbi:MAG: sigma-70 family RNA polymerase sigma factor [Spirosomataceae bacterium]